MKIKNKNIKKIFFKILNKFWQNLFLILIALLLLDAIIGAFYFFHYSSKVEKEESGFYLPLDVNRNLIDNLLADYQKRQILFEDAKEKTYPDLFQKIEFGEIIEKSE